MKKQLVLGMMVVLAISAGVQAAIPQPISYYTFNDGLNNEIAGGAPVQVTGNAGTSSSRYITDSGAFYKPFWDGIGTTSSVSEINGTNDWTISFWMDPMQMSNYHPVISYGDPDGKFMMMNTNGNFSLYYTGYGDYANLTWANFIDQWRFFAFSANSAEGTFTMYSGLYGDTQLTRYVLHTIQLGESLNASNALVLGARGPGGTDGGSALYIDELAIWDQGLSQSQLMEAFAAGKAGQMLVPEPTMMVLMGISLLAGIIRRKR